MTRTFIAENMNRMKVILVFKASPSILTIFLKKL